MKTEFMKQYIISTPKQENGIWGTPFQCVKMGKIIVLSDENWLKRSALIMGISEIYKNETFEIFWEDEKGFYYRLSESGIKSMKYEHYELNENMLTWIGQPTDYNTVE